jgi:pSer/pThr/pTyr-binding forkhead associated (FHA) protein
MPARLVPLTPGSAPVVDLQRPVLLVGRHPECDVRLDLPSISRRHCLFALAYDRLTIRDLGSRHGVWVNGVLSDESRIHPGDEIAIGPLLFRFEDSEPAPQPRTPPASAQAKPAPAAPPTSSLPDLPIDPEGDLVPLSELFPL